MADSQKLKYSQIAEANLLGPLKKELEEVNSLLGTTETNLKAMVAEAAKLAKQTPLDSYDNLDKVQKGISDVKKGVEELDKVEKDRLKLQERLSQLDDERVKANFELKEQIRRQSKELRDNAKAAANAGNAYEELKKNTNEAQLEFKRLAAEFGANSKQAKEARKAFERFDDQLREVNDAAKDGRRDVGRYEKGVASLTKTFKTFASATIILKVLELLQNQVSNNSDGVAELEKIWVRVTATFQVVAGRLVEAFKVMKAGFEGFMISVQLNFAKATNIFGRNQEEVDRLTKAYEALGTGGRSLSDVFSGMGAEISDLIDKKVKLIDDTLQYRREIVGLEKDIANLIPTQEKLRAQFENDATSLEEQIVAGVAFRKELQKRQELEERIAVRRLRLAQQNAAVSKANVDAQEELAAATLEYNQLIADQATELASTEREIQKLRDDATQLNLDFYIDDLDNRKTVNERIIADETQTFARRGELLAANLRLSEEGFKLEEEALNKSLAERGKAQLNFDELRQKSGSEEIARIIRESGISEPLAIRALEVLRERRTFLQDNAEAQRDLNQAEAESRRLQSDILLQQEALNRLQAEGVDLNKVLKTLSESRLQNDIDNLRERIDVAKEGSGEFIKLNQELNDKLLEQATARNEEQVAKLEKFGQAANDAFQLLSDLAKQRSEKRVEAIDEEIDAEQKRLDRLQELAAAGNETAEENLALASKRQAQLQLERKRELERQQRNELALTAVQTYSSKVSANDPNPLASTIADIQVLRAFVSTLPGFFEGTEDTGNAGLLKDKHGAITGFTHENERVLKADQNKLIGSLTNAELTMLAHKHNTKGGEAVRFDGLVKEIRELKEETKKRPVYLGQDYDEVSRSITSRIKTGQKLEKIHKKNGGHLGLKYGFTDSTKR